MGFIQGNYIPKVDEIIDNAFKAGKKEAGGIDEKDKKIYIKMKEKERIKVASEKVIGTLEGIVKKFPSLDRLNEFYAFMLRNSVDIPTLKKALGHLNVSTKMIRRMRAEYLLKLNGQSYVNAGKIRAEFYGRMRSIVKDTKKSLETIRDGYKVIANIPHMKDLPSILIIGLPNVGKSTLLKNLTGSNVEIKDYPFTTKKLQLGYLKHKYLDFQLVDSPGLLDRPEDKHNEIELQTIIALKHLANSIVFVVAVNDNLKGQKGLVKKYVGEKPSIVVFNKINTIDKTEFEEFKEEFLKGLSIEKETIFEIDQKEIGKNEQEILDKIKDLVYRQNKTFFKG